MSKKKLVNNTDIPQYAIEIFARCIYPAIVASFQSEEGQQGFAKWQAEQAKKKAAEIRRLLSLVCGCCEINK